MIPHQRYGPQSLSTTVVRPAMIPTPTPSPTMTYTMTHINRNHEVTSNRSESPTFPLTCPQDDDRPRSDRMHSSDTDGPPSSTWARITHNQLPPNVIPALPLNHSMSRIQSIKQSPDYSVISTGHLLSYLGSSLDTLIRIHTTKYPQTAIRRHAVSF